MRLLLAIAGLSLVACSASPAATALPDALVIDCVGHWSARGGSMTFLGNHPDRDPDEGVCYPGNGEPVPLRYAVVGRRLRLWLAHGQQVVDTEFRLVTVADDFHAWKYELRLAQPVMGVRVFEGTLTRSMRCEPRPPPAAAAGRHTGR